MPDFKKTTSEVSSTNVADQEKSRDKKVLCFSWAKIRLYLDKITITEIIIGTL